MDLNLVLDLAISLGWFLVAIFAFDACNRLSKFLKNPDCYLSQQFTKIMYRFIYVFMAYSAYAFLKGFFSLPFSWVPRFQS